MAYVSQLSGKKYQKDTKNLLFNEHVATGPSSFAKRQLESMGWKEGEGLGKHRQGRSTHIRVSKRNEEEGLGHVERPKSMYEDQWWNSSINVTLAKLQQQRSSKKKAKSKDKVQKVITTDEELFLATGGARFGMRAQYRAEGKWARTEKKDDDAISAMEEKAQKSMEWNGLGEAKVKLTSITTTTTNQVTVEKEKSKTNPQSCGSVDHKNKKTKMDKVNICQLSTTKTLDVEGTMVNTISPETSSEDSDGEQSFGERKKEKKKRKEKRKKEAVKKKSKKRKRTKDNEC